MQKINYDAEEKKIDWKSIVDVVNDELVTYHRQGFAPSLRTMFYRLVSKGIISNTKYTYKGLSSATVKARMDRRLPIDSFSDSTRRTIKGFNSEFRTIDEILQEDYIDELKGLPAGYPDLIPRWYKQPEYVEIWVEKEAMTGTFESILDGRDVEIVPNKGFSSLTFL